MIDFEQYRYGFDENINNWAPEGEEPNRFLQKNIESNYLSIQTVPGVKVQMIYSNNEIGGSVLIGSSGVLEMDFSNNKDLNIPMIKIQEQSIQLIEQSNGYIIVNFGKKENKESEG